MSDPFKSVKSFKYGQKTGHYYSLKALGEQLGKDLSRLPVSIRIVLESVLRNCDGKKVTEQHVKQLASWKPRASRTAEIPFVVARVVLQDFTGVPLLADLAAMRNVASGMGKNPKTIEPLVPVDLVVDDAAQARHSFQVNHHEGAVIEAHHAQQIVVLELARHRLGGFLGLSAFVFHEGVRMLRRIEMGGRKFDREE